MSSTINIGGCVDRYFVATFGVVMPAHDGPHLADRVDGFVASAKERIAADMVRKAQERLDDEGRQVTLHMAKHTGRGPYVGWTCASADDEGYEDLHRFEVADAFEDFTSDADWMQEVLAQWELVVARVDESRFGQVLVLGDA